MQLLSRLPGLAALALIGFSFNVQAAPITIEFTATVNSVQNPSAITEVSIGDTITGSYTFDTDVPDTNTDPNIANHKIDAPLPSGIGFALNISSLTFTPETTPAGADATVNVYNGSNYELVDFSQCCDAGHLSNGAEIVDIMMTFHHPQDLFNTSVLSETIPYLNSMADRDMRIAGYLNGLYFEIMATVTEVNPTETSCLVPAQNSVRFSAEVVNIYDSSTNGLAGMIQLNDTISGEYRFNPDIADTDPNPEFAVYPHEPGEPGSGFIINIADTTLSSKNTTSFFDVVLQNGPTDKYGVYTTDAAMPLPNGSIITDVRFELENHSGTAFDSLNLLDISPAALTTWDRYELYIDGRHNDGSNFTVIARLSSIIEGPFVAKNTEAALAISPGSGKFISEQQFDTLLVYKAPESDITNVNIYVSNGSNSRGLNCSPGPLLSGGTMHSIICSSAANPLLGPGINILNAEISFFDGTTLKNSVEWEMLQ